MRQMDIGQSGMNTRRGFGFLHDQRRKETKSDCRTYGNIDTRNTNIWRKHQGRQKAAAGLF